MSARYDPDAAMTKMYGAEINLDVENAHTRVIRMVGRGKRVLELGCGIGHMTRVFTARGCTVTAVEVSIDAVAQARDSGARIIAGDLETIDWASTVGDDRFDVIVAADVLEHLRNPTSVLMKAGKYLADDGAIVASIPNIAHLSVIAELLQGRFGYQPTGLLDDSHVRFFTRNSLYECFEEAGFEISCLERVTVRPEETEFHTDFALFPAELVALLESREEATTYQFVLSAHRSTTASIEIGHARRESGGPSLRLDPLSGARAALDGRLTDDAAALDGFIQAVAARSAFVESGQQHLIALVAKLREQLLKSEAHIGWLTSEIRRREAGLDHSQSEPESHIDALRSEVERLTSHASALEAHVAQLLSERGALGGDFARQLEDVQRAHSAEIELARKDRGRLANQIADLQRAHEATSRRLIEERLRFGAELELAQQERGGLASQIEGLSYLVGVVEKSLSWRVTAPLRWARRILRERAGRKR
jgi:2-polyprenyl-3-methyl-5-hydroxy-6-metoxy-1,4-benzoquinol methylase/predicted  nucleic acid-binding Zn-ribbon protein